MTITAVRYLEAESSDRLLDGKSSPKLPPRLWHSSEPPFRGYQPAPSEGYLQTTDSTAIVIDNGLHSALL